MKDEHAAKFNILEGSFRKHHGNILREEANAIEMLINECRSVNLPCDVISYYFRCRIYFRIKILNKKLKCNSYLKRSKLMKCIQ